MEQSVIWAGCGAAVLVVGYLGLVLRVARSAWTTHAQSSPTHANGAVAASAGPPRAVGWAWWRSLCFVAGCLLFVVAVWASPGGFERSHRANASWIGGGSVGVVTSILPVLLVLGSPAELCRRAGLRVGRLAGRGLPMAVRWLVHPLVAGPLNCLLLILLFASGWYDSAQAGGAGWLALLLVVLAGGLLPDVGLLLPGALPGMSPGMRVLWSGVDGLLDEIPGIAVMAIQSKLVGGAMWAIAQPVVLPLLAVLLLRWLQHDRELALRTDAELDEMEWRRREEIASALRYFSREEQQRDH